VTWTNYPGDAFILSAAQVMAAIARLMTLAACAGAACCLLTCGLRWTWTRARARRRRRREHAAFGAEVARGLAQIDEFLRASTSAPEESADTEPGAGPGHDPHLCGGNGAEGPDGSDG
jgi:hypothetical protein